MNPQNVTSMETPKLTIKERIIKHKTALAFTAGAAVTALSAYGINAYKNKSDELNADAHSAVDDLTAIMDAVAEKTLPDNE